MLAASRHRGTSVMEFLTNCVIFNNGSHAEISDKEVKADRTIVLRDGEKMIFGKNRDKGIALDGWKLKVVTLGENGVTEDDVLTHDSHSDNLGLQTMLADMKWPEFPVALGVIREVSDITYDEEVARQVETVKEKSKIHNVDELLHSGSTWELK